jgi:hypothetical protein
MRRRPFIQPANFRSLRTYYHIFTGRGWVTGDISFPRRLYPVADVEVEPGAKCFCPFYITIPTAAGSVHSGAGASCPTL